MTRILPKGPVKPAMPENITFRGTQEPRRRQPSLVAEPRRICLGSPDPPPPPLRFRERVIAALAILVVAAIAYGGLIYYATLLADWIERVTR